MLRMPKIWKTTTYKRHDIRLERIRETAADDAFVKLKKEAFK